MSADLINLFGKRPSPVLEQGMLPPMFQAYLDLATAYTDARSGLLLTAWLPFCAVNLGNRVYMVNNSTRVYPNIWSCVIGPSSVSRKSTALRYAGYTVQPYERALRDSPLAEYEQNTQLLTGTTLAKLMSYLALNPARLFVHNEISAWLHEMNKSYNAGYKQVVTEIFDNVDRTVANRERTERIVRPALSIAAASTEGWLFRNLLDGADQLSGFLQRMLFFVIRKVDESELDLTTRSGEDLEGRLAEFDARWFSPWRAIAGSHRLDLSPEAVRWRDAQYEEEYRAYFRQNNDTLLSYFTRIFDGYFFKFCALIHMSKHTPNCLSPQSPSSCNSCNSWTEPPFLDNPQSRSVGWVSRNPVLLDESPTHQTNPWTAPSFLDNPEAFFAATRVSAETAAQAWYLCRFYMENTLPLLDIMDEKDKLSGERKVVDLLIHKFNGKARHSELMNACHMRKKEFQDIIASLIDREALKVETYSSRTMPGKMYLLDPAIIQSWSA